MENDFLKKILHEGFVEIVFDKVDGTRRVMLCTLNNQYIAEHTDPVSTEYTSKSRKENPNLVVFDTEKNSWRSIRPDSIISYRQLENV